MSIVTTRGGSGQLGKVWFEQRTYPQMVGQVGADIAHVPYWGPPLSSPARLVTSVLDVIPLAIPDYAQGFKARLYTSLVTAAARGSQHILTLSDASKADIVKFLDIPAESITTTYLAADEAYHPRLGRNGMRRCAKSTTCRISLCWASAASTSASSSINCCWPIPMSGRRKGDNIPLVLAGREPAWGTGVFPDLPKYAEELNITDYVRWIGYVDEEDKPSLYRLADVFVFPSIYEGFGLPMLEAMACGTPVVANEVSSIPEVAGDAAYLVKPGDARAMAGAIIALLLQEPLRDSLVNQGLARATNFSWRKTAKETLAVYEQVMAM